MFGGGSKCQRLTIPMCTDMKYNLTRFPNDFGHEDQKEAGMEVKQFAILLL